MSGRESWNMSRIVSRRPLPKERKLHANTIGEQPQQQSQHLRSCKGCGYHLCACRRRERPDRAVEYNLGQTFDRADATLKAMNRAREALERSAARSLARQERARISDSSWLQLRDGCCDDCARARREAVTHCMCGRPTGC